MPKMMMRFWSEKIEDAGCGFLKLEQSYYCMIITFYECLALMTWLNQRLR